VTVVASALILQKRYDVMEKKQVFLLCAVPIILFSD
jgi:hypothetical protein